MSKRHEIKVDDRFKNFLDMVAKTGEHFPEYIVIVKTHNGNLDWRSSDKTWAMGAAERYLNICHEEDGINLRNIE